MTSKEFKNEFTECCCNCSSDFFRSYPILTTVIASTTILSTASLVNPKARKVLLPAFKYLGKQQLKLFAGIGIFSIATYIAKQNTDLNDDFDINDISNNDTDEIILNNTIK